MRVHRFAAPAAPAVVAFVALVSPTTVSAAPPALSAAPDAGDVAVAQAVISTRGAGRGVPRLALTRRAALPSGALVVGGVRKVRRGRYLASFAVIRPEAGARARAAAPVAVRAQLRIPRGMRFARFASRAVASDVADRRAPARLCRTLPRTFSHGARRPLAGTPLSGFAARSTLKYAFWLGCRNWPDRAEFVAALRQRGVSGDAQPDGSGGGTTGGEDEAGSGDGSVPPECQADLSACDPQDGPPASSTLSGSGSVTRDANDANLYRYSIQFNEPIQGYRVVADRASVECPTATYSANHAKCEGLGDSQRPSAGGADLRCQDGESVVEFLCALPQSRGGSASTIPAGTTITGSFTVSYGSVRSGEVRVYGQDARGAETTTPFALSGPE